VSDLEPIDRRGVVGSDPVNGFRDRRLGEVRPGLTPEPAPQMGNDRAEPSLQGPLSPVFFASLLETLLTNMGSVAAIIGSDESSDTMVLLDVSDPPEVG
jgi:hypothetical protein